MSEVLQKSAMEPTEQIVPAEQLLFEESFQRFNSQLDNLTTTIPEIYQNKDSLTETGSEIIEQYGIKPELFDDSGRALVFCAITSRWNANKGANGSDADAENTFLADSITLLAYKHSDKLADAKNQIEKEDSPISDEARQKVYDKFTDSELSGSVTEAISGGLLNSVKERLGITDANEDQYEVRALSIGDFNQSMGLDAPRPDFDLPYNHPDLVSDLTTYDQIEGWKNGLEDRSKKFAAELGMDAVFGPAWVTQIGEKRLLCISSALAEKLVDRDSTKHSRIYNEDDFLRDFAILEHEYTHTQGGLMLDRGVTFGINLEELRAEHFSGNKQGYQDIKGLFLDYAIAVGEHPADIFDANEKGGDIEKVYGDVANKVGLARMLEVVLASPKNYIDAQSNEFSRRAYEYIGGFDGVIGKLVEDQMQAGKSAELEDRITNRAQRVAEIAGKDDNEWLWDYRRNMGLNVMTDLVNKKAEDLGLKTAA